ncbi:MAG: Transposase [Candidatus Midichloria mitochondrii]
MPMEEEGKSSAKHPQEFAVALRSSIKTSWIMPLKEFFDSTNEVSAFVL